MGESVTRDKLAPAGHETHVIYDDQVWHILGRLRSRARETLEFLEILGPCFAYGSVARGDVSEKSDLDIILLDVVPSYKVIQAVDKLGLNIRGESIVMATPNHAIKGMISLEMDIVITFPLIEFSQRDLDFYNFGGKVNLDQLRKNSRVVGVTKSLLLISPTEEGHYEKSLLGLPKKEIQKYGLSQQILEERLRVLERRDSIGRTGVFVDEPVHPELGFEGTLRWLRDRNNLIRNRMMR